MDNTYSVRLHPPGVDAAEQFLAAGFREGDVVPHSWFYVAFGLEVPSPDMPAGRYKEIELAHLKQFKIMEEVLRSEHQIHLKSKPGVGYEVVPIGEQVTWASSESVKELRRAVHKLGARLSNIDVTRLTDQGRREYTDHVARLGRIKNMMSQVRQLPTLPPPVAQDSAGVDS